jgi:hypothetical protein
MAQSDQAVQNATFPTVRADINDNLAALYSQSSGPSAPTTTVAFQPWVDTSSSPPVWKIRNAANTGWITVGVLDPAGFESGGVTPIANGGTGATTASGAINALVPSQSGNNDYFLQTNGTSVLWAAAAAGLGLQVFTSSGTFTPTAGKTTFLVFCTGGGGGSGWSTSVSGSNYADYSGAGGAGGTGVRLYSSAEMGSSAAVTVGAGGSGGTSGNDGGSGGTSSLNPIGSGVTLSATGGSGGVWTRAQYDVHPITRTSGGGFSNAQFGIDGAYGISYTTSSTRSSGTIGDSFSQGGRGIFGGNGAIGRLTNQNSGENGFDGDPGIVIVLEL